VPIVSAHVRSLLAYPVGSHFSPGSFLQLDLLILPNAVVSLIRLLSVYTVYYTAVLIVLQVLKAAVQSI